jgi:4-alpha-glucanotransferase
VKRIRATLELTDLIRIDHFRGFESFWAVPAVATTARSGSWEVGPGDDLFDAMHRSLGELPIVGGNWRWRVLDEQLAADFCDNIASLVSASERGIFSNGRK